MADPMDARGGEAEVEISVDTESVQDEVVGTSNLVAERFDKYLIVGELALGGMAELFLAVQRGLEGFVKVVVIKRVLPQFAANADFVRMFIDEARLAARLEHANIVRTYEFGEFEGQYFTAMEYLPGEDLTKVLNRICISRQKMQYHVAATIIAQVCAGLHFAHELTDVAGHPLQLVHRDVNPANVIVTYGGDVKIIDFGVAKTTNNAKTVTGTIKGKLAYMSPEQLLGRGIDRRSDIFSTGVVLWEMLCGRPLFVRDSEAATLYAIMNDPIPNVARYRPDVPAELVAIVERALSRTPVDRFETAEEMQLALEAFADRYQKCDARSRSQMLEDLFGPTRAEAKRSIAQTRALSKNVSLVMKLRSEVRDDLAETFDALALGTDRQSTSAEPVAAEAEQRGIAGLLFAALAVLCIAGGLTYYFVKSSPDQPIESAQAAPVEAGLVVESTPPGAAISIDGEPTGKRTPATLTGIRSARVTLKLELEGREPIFEIVDVPSVGKVPKRYTFSNDLLPSRFAIAGVPTGGSIVVDGEEYEPGTVITVTPGTHDVRIVAGGRTITQQSLEAKPGDQRWKLVGGELQPLGPGT